MPAVEAVLRQMAALPNCKAWYSLDRETGRPEEKPPGVRYCYMQDADGAVGGVDLVFRTRRMVDRPLVGLPGVPSDTPSGRRAGHELRPVPAYCFDD